MHTKRMTVTVNGPVIINVAGDAHNTDLRKQREGKHREICSLIERIQTNPRDNEAVEELLRRFRGMARSVVKNHNVQSSERDFMQGVAEEAIWHAAQHIDINYESFAPYFRRVMDTWIERAMCHGYILYIPEEIRRQIWKLENFMRRTGYEEAYSGISPNRYAWTDEKKKQAMEELGISEKKLMELIAWSVLASVEPLLADDPEDSALEDGMSSDKNHDLMDESMDVEEAYDRKELCEAVRQAVGRFCSPEELEVIAVSFGLDGGYGLSQEKTAEELTRRKGKEVTKTDVRRIQRQVFAKIRKEMPELKEYLF